ncbi:MAG: hypothetical protein EAZ55_11300 [Cytophagales bacterium]|nr:MAG: hypothetical protein EAZ55_11300 [Cytophagales bacterium]
MKKYFSIFLLCLIIVACNNNNKEEAQSKNAPMISEKELETKKDFNNMVEALSKPDSVYRLNLQSLQLKNLPENIEKLKKIQLLYLDDNPELDWQKTLEKLTELKNLHDLSLSSNKLKNLPNNIKQIEALRILWIDDNPELDWQETFNALKDCKNLKELSLKMNNIKTIPDNIGTLLQLEKLYLSNNTLRTVPQSLNQLKKLTFLEINNNKDSLDLKTLFTTLSQIPTLKTLQLSRCKISTIPDEIALLTQVEKIWLDGNQIIGFPKGIEKLKNLKVLKIFNNPLLPETEKRLKELLPNTEIEADIIVAEQ